MISRRAFLGTVAGGLLTAPLAARAQQVPKLSRVGILCPVQCWFFSIGGDYSSAQKTFRQMLGESGYVEGKNITLDLRGRGVPYDSLGRYATALVQQRVGVILAEGWAAAEAARKATATIPIVMVAAGDPVETGLVASLARPGGNITGLSVPSRELLGKQLELLKEVEPTLLRVGVLSNAGNPEHELALKGIEAPASALGVQVQVFKVRAEDPTALLATLSAAGHAGIRALIVLSDATFVYRGEAITTFAIKNRVLTISEHQYFVHAGGLMAYGPSLIEISRRIAVYVGKILKGTRPGDLPVEQPTQFSLVISSTTARALGVTIPPSVLLRADEVIQ